MASSDADWAYGDFQIDQLRDLIRQQEAQQYGREPDSDGRAVNNYGDGTVDPEALGLSQAYNKGLKVVPDNYSTSTDIDNDNPNSVSETFDPDLYQDFRELMDKLEEGKFYEACLSGEPTLTTADLTWNFLLKEFTALYGPCPTSSGCPSTGPMAEQLAEYKRFRVEQLEGWLKNIQERGDKIFVKMEYEWEELAPMRPAEVQRILDTCFTLEQLASFDLNPLTNPSGADQYLIPRPEMDPTCIQILSSAVGDKQTTGTIGSEAGNKYEGAYGIKVEEGVSDEVLHLYCRELTTLGALDPKMNVTGSHFMKGISGQMLAERIRECLMRYPLGIHFSKFIEVFEEYVGYIPDLENFFLTRYSDMSKEQNDIFWSQFEPEFPPVGPKHLNQEILFPAHCSEIYADLFTILSRIWRKYRLMVALLSSLMPLTEIAWKKFESFLADTDTETDAQSLSSPVFHYSDWGFESHEAFTRFCIGKWKNTKFYILEPGTVVTGIPGTVLERSIYFGEKETVGSYLIPQRIFQPTPLRYVIPSDCSMDGSLVRRFSDRLRVGDVDIFCAGEFVNPHLFGVIHSQYWLPFQKRFKPQLQMFYGQTNVDIFKVLPERLEYGKIIIACYRNEWERATIVKPIRRNLFLVYLVDWAVFAPVDYRHMRYMAKQFMDFPAVGVLCKLESSEEIDYYFTEERRWDEKASVKFMYSMLNKALEIKFVDVDNYMGQPIWTVRVRLLENLSSRMCVIPDLNRQVFLEKCKAIVPGTVSNDGGVKCLRQTTRRRILYTNFEPTEGPAEKSVDDDTIYEKEAFPEPVPLVSVNVRFHVLADPRRQPKIQKDVADLSDLNSCEAGSNLAVSEEELVIKEEPIPARLSTPTQSIDPLVKPLPIYFESKLRNMKRSFRVPYGKPTASFELSES